MTDSENDNNRRMYTEEEVYQLFQKFREDERSITQNSREEKPLPLDIIDYLEGSTTYQIQENFKRYKRDLSRYQQEEWTVGEEVNKSLLPKLKAFTVDTSQVVNAIYRSLDLLRTNGRAATELFEQLTTLQEGNVSHEEANQLLSTTVENAKRMAIYSWYQARQQDNEAKAFATDKSRVGNKCKQ